MAEAREEDGRVSLGRAGLWLEEASLDLTLDISAYMVFPGPSLPDNVRPFKKQKALRMCQGFKLLSFLVFVNQTKTTRDMESPSSVPASNASSAI